MPVTIEDIAKHLGLAVSTVSKALNNYSDVSQKTKNRVLEVARELDYYPSAAARNLRRQRTDKIGFLFSYPITVISEYASRLITGAITSTEKDGYNLIIYPLRGNQLARLNSIYRTREVDGVLLLGTGRLEEAILLLERAAMPFVVVGRRVEHPSWSFVAPDDMGGALVVVRHLIGLGHKRIAYTTRPALGATSTDRLAGYKQALSEADIPFDKNLVVPTVVEPGSGYQAMITLLDLPNPPTAIFAIHDLVAIECLEASTDRGLRVPQDIAIAGFDNWRSSLLTSPPLTTVHSPLFEIGRRATEILLARVTDKNLPPVRQILPVELVARQSTVNV